MSFEGRYQYLCENGHKWEVCVYSVDGKERRCPTCKKKAVFFNLVDDTNCDSYGIITDESWKKLEISPEKVEVCNLGHKHITEPARYRKPTDEELDKFRSFWDSESRKFIQNRSF